MWCYMYVSADQGGGGGVKKILACRNRCYFLTFLDKQEQDRHGAGDKHDWRGYHISGTPQSTLHADAMLGLTCICSGKI